VLFTSVFKKSVGFGSRFRLSQQVTLVKRHALKNIK